MSEKEYIVHTDGNHEAQLNSAHDYGYELAAVHENTLYLRRRRRRDDDTRWIVRLVSFVVIVGMVLAFITLWQGGHP